MESKEKRALNKFADEIIRDLEPSSTFLHSLYARNILTEEHIDIINEIPSREQKVTKILQILPRRGPEAFSAFKSCLGKDYHWLEEKLTNEVQRLKEGQIGINKKFVSTIEMKLDPLVYHDEEDVEVCTENTHPNNIVKKLSSSLTDLEKRCYKALCITVGPKKFPLHQLIERRMKEARKQDDLIKTKQEKDNKAEEQTALLQSLTTEKKELQDRLTVIHKNLVSSESIIVPLVYTEAERSERGIPNSKSATTNTIKRLNDTIIEHQQRCLKALDLKPSQAKIPIHMLISRRLREERGKDAMDNTEQNKDVMKIKKKCDATKKENETLKKKVVDYKDKHNKTLRDLRNCQSENIKLKAENAKLRLEQACWREMPREKTCITSLFD